MSRYVSRNEVDESVSVISCSLGENVNGTLLARVDY